MLFILLLKHDKSSYLNLSVPRVRDKQMPRVPTSEIKTQRSRLSCPAQNKTPCCQVYILFFAYIIHFFRVIPALEPAPRTVHQESRVHLQVTVSPEFRTQNFSQEFRTQNSAITEILRNYSLFGETSTKTKNIFGKKKGQRLTTPLKFAACLQTNILLHRRLPLE